MKHTFRGGIHPLHGAHEGKTATADKPIRPYVTDYVCIPMDMHLGAPSTPCVKKGDRVKIGQMIGEAVGPRGIPVHASISGDVVSVESKQQLLSGPSMCVTIHNDFLDEWVPLEGLGNVETAPKDKIIDAVRRAGVCGMGGACFPSHAKMTLPAGKTVDTIILNGAECETFLTSDHRLMLESPGRVVDGLRAVMRAMDVKRGVIAIEDNKPDAIAAMEKAAQGRAGVEIRALVTKYPQGGERQLIQAVTGRQVPIGGLPMDAQVVVFNVGTAAAIADAVVNGRPLIERVTTVTGAVQEPANLLVRIGTPFHGAIVGAGGYQGEPGKIFAGGSMTGVCAPNDEVSVTKATNGIVVLTEKQAALSDQTQCIRCGRCVNACPARLMPYKLHSLYEGGDLDAAVANHLKECMLCGACSYVCPAKLWLTASFKTAKEQLARRA